MKSDPATFDPGDSHSSVGQEQGRVRSDRDWNRPQSGGPGRRPVPAAIILPAAAALGLVLIGVAIWVLPVIRARLQASGTLVVLSRPIHGDVVPLHSTIAAIGEAQSQRGVRGLQLWVNGQLWAERTYDPAPPSASVSWSWTPSGEGEHELQVVAVDGQGRTARSSASRIFATARADVRFPYVHTVQPGENLDLIAEAFDTDSSTLLEANPHAGQGVAPGSQLTIPIAVPNLPPAEPQSGEPAAPPVEPAPDAGQPQVLAFLGEIFLSAEDRSADGFWFMDGAVVPGTPVDRLYLYYKLDGSDWRRIPEGQDNFLAPNAGVFHISEYLDVELLEASTTSVHLVAEAWGWQGGTLVFLGSYDGVLGGGNRSWPPTETQLKIETYTALAIPHYAAELNLTGEDPGKQVVFEWETPLPAATFGRWQVSTTPFPIGTGLNPPGLIHFGTAYGQGGQFTINFNQYLDTGGGGSSLWDLSSLISQGQKQLGELLGEPSPQGSFSPDLPQTFYIRVIPMAGVSGVYANAVGPSSNSTIVRYLPSGQALPPGTASGPIYQARILGFTPYRAADSAFANCSVLTKDIVMPHPITGEPWVLSSEGAHSCGCPGVSCDSGGSSCGEFSLDGLGDCIEDGANALAGGLTSLVGLATDLYNGAKEFVVDLVADAVCGDDPICRAGVEIAVNAGMAALGLPPEIPDFDKLFSEGLDYALAAAAEQITGFHCDATCRDLLKAGFEGVSNPDKLFEDGLAYGASLAADELDIECDSQCQQLIESAAKGNLSGDEITEAALNAAADQAAAELNNQNYECDPACRNEIKESLAQGAKLGQQAANTSVSQPQEPQWLPHELALEQPAIIRIEIFRRWETASLRDEDLEVCGLSVDNLATNQLAGVPVSGRLFEAKGIDLPVLEPGESVVIPLVLERAPWQAPTDALAALAGQELPAGLAPEDVSISIDLPGLPGKIDGNSNLWPLLYFGSQIEFKAWGPFILAKVGDDVESFPCVAEISEIRSAP
ncbi:MAG TPA: LysM domain-containing protein [Anaerolineales bacterium]